MCEALYMYVCSVIWVNNKLLAGRKCDISVCTADIFKPRDYLVRGKSVFSYCGIILLTRLDYTFSRRATFSPDAFINYQEHLKNVIEKDDYETEETVFQGDIPQDEQLCEDYRHEVGSRKI